MMLYPTLDELTAKVGNRFYLVNSLGACYLTAIRTFRNNLTVSLESSLCCSCLVGVTCSFDCLLSYLVIASSAMLTFC